MPTGTSQLANYQNITVHVNYTNEIKRRAEEIASTPDALQFYKSLSAHGHRTLKREGVNKKGPCFQIYQRGQGQSRRPSELAARRASAIWVRAFSRQSRGIMRGTRREEFSTAEIHLKTTGKNKAGQL